MEKPDIIAELDEYCRRTGRSPSTVTANATGNPRLRDRLLSRIERTASDAEKLRKFMADNPPVDPEAASCPTVSISETTDGVNQEPAK